MLEREGVCEPSPLSEELRTVDGISGRDSWVYFKDVAPGGWAMLQRMAAQPGARGQCRLELIG